MSRQISEFRTGWRNLLAASIGLGVGVPCYTPVSSLFFRALEREFGWSKAAAAGALIALPITAAVLPFAGSLIDRLGVRRVIAASVIGLVTCFIWLSRQGGSVGEFYAAMIALNVLGCATGPIGYTRIVVGQFRLARGTALAVAQFGIAFLAVLLPPLLGLAMAANGWRGGYLLLAGACLGGGIAAQFLMRPTATAASTQEIGGVDVGKAVRMPALWILGVSLLAISAASLGLVSQLQSLLIEKGVPQSNTPWLLSLLAASVMLSRLAVGRLLDLPRPERSAAAIMALATAGAAFLLVGNEGMAFIVVGIALLGCSVGAELDFMSFFCAREFGLRHYSAVYGVLAMFFYSGIAIGGVGYGAIHDVTGSYGPALLASVILLLCSSLLLLWLGHGTNGQRRAL